MTSAKFRHGLLIALVLLGVTEYFRCQEPPISLSELHSMISTTPLRIVAQRVGFRGVSFVNTPSVRSNIEAWARKSWSFDDNGYAALVNAIQEKQPQQLLIAIAPFRGASDAEREQLQIDMANELKRQLKQLKESASIIKFIPREINSVVADDSEAVNVGDEIGVHMVLWGEVEWTSTHEAVFHARIRIIQLPPGLAKIITSQRQTFERLYRLEFAELDRLRFLHSAGAKISNIVSLLIAISYYSRYECDSVAQVLNSLSDPDSEAYIYLGHCARRGRKFEDAKKYYKKALEQDPTSLVAGHSLGTMQYMTQDYSGAKETFSKVLLDHPDSDKTLDNMGITLAEQDQYEDALKYLDQARRTNPRNHTAFVNYTAVMFESDPHRAEEAARILYDYLKQHDTDHAGWFTLGQMFSAFGDHRQAAKSYVRAVSSDPGEVQYWVQLINELGFSWDIMPRDLESYRDLLKLLIKSKLSQKQIQTFRETLIPKLIIAYVKADKYEAAHVSFQELGIQSNNCRVQLAQRLIDGDFGKVADTDEPARLYYTSIYSLFFQMYGTWEFTPDTLLQAFDSLLRSDPTSHPLIAAKAILEMEIVSRHAGQDADRMTREALRSLPNLKGSQGQPAAFDKLRQCMQKIR